MDNRNYNYIEIEFADMRGLEETPDLFEVVLIQVGQVPASTHMFFPRAWQHYIQLFSASKKTTLQCNPNSLHAAPKDTSAFISRQRVPNAKPPLYPHIHISTYSYISTYPYITILLYISISFIYIHISRQGLCTHATTSKEFHVPALHQTRARDLSSKG